jgi:hypothetical protein
MQDCSDQLFKKLFLLHIEKLQDPSENVIRAVQDSLVILILYSKNLLEKYLDQIVPTVLINMVSHNDLVSTSSSDLINLICQKSSPSDIILILMDILNTH